MSTPKLHHYVPQFYLRRFTDASGRLWLWDRNQDCTFATRPNSVAAENNFYHLTELIKHGYDPLTMEKQFSDLEGQVALITDQWLGWLQQVEPEEKIEIPDVNRENVSLYIALQFLRTADSREILAAFVEESEKREPMSAEEKRRLHTDMLWDDKLVWELADRIQNAIWLFGRNTTATPFITSDNPVAFRTGDNAMWLKVGLYTAGTSAVFPLAPEVVMYCYPNGPPWQKIAQFDRCLSPVVFTDEMVESENSGQVFMASRFVISRRNNFDYERAFTKTIGTDRYARDRPTGA
jgi:Protein of unknown function (DUF4238)